MDDAAPASITDAVVPSAGLAKTVNVLLAVDIEQIVAQLRTEYRPTTLTEDIFIKDVARHAAALQVIERAEPALLRMAASTVTPLASPGTTVSTEDFLLAAAITTEPLD